MCEYTPFHRRLGAHEVYVSESAKREALKRLHERIDAGEDVYTVLGMSEEHKYYVEKLKAGLCPLSYGLYGRIMNLDEEDDFSE